MYGGVYRQCPVNPDTPQPSSRWLVSASGYTRLRVVCVRPNQISKTIPFYLCKKLILNYDPRYPANYRPRTADPSTLTTDNLLTLANIITTSLPTKPGSVHQCAGHHPLPARKPAVTNLSWCFRYIPIHYLQSDQQRTQYP